MKRKKTARKAAKASAASSAASSNACCCGEKNPFVAIGASLGGIFLAICALFLIFASHQAGLLVPIAWAFAVMAIALGLFAMKRK